VGEGSGHNVAIGGGSDGSRTGPYDRRSRVMPAEERALTSGALAPFFAMSKRYGQLYQRMVDMLEKLDPDELDRRPERRAAIDELPAGTLASMWVDIDATIAGANVGGQANIEEAIDLHIGAVEAWIRSLEAELRAG
jgi:hypothetical protein